ncbi:hypothetical protein R4P48_13790 [Atlantibacter subterranea]|uniref:Uncharacterized protein n=1 Tax=Atlantibacter subterraneus TaxID=255519 RepID=A0ABU4E3P7_9ENTR|nr:hypothetical protein [Atlantibacter subterranea]MDV7023743.1 hypothetical protein [Atlantibacter subterranea]
MNHIEFIEKNVREELIRAGFPVSVAQGGRGRRSTFTDVCLKPARKAQSLMTAYASQNCGLKNKPQKPN